MPIRSERALFAGLAIYFVVILGSQATMSLGIGVVLLGAFFGFGSPKRVWEAMRDSARMPETRRYLRATNFLTLACFLSLLFAWLAPVVLHGEKPEVRFVSDMWKAWYFYWPLMTVPCLLALSPPVRRRVYRVYLYTFGAMALMGIVQFFTGWPIAQGIPGLPGRYHVTGFPGFHLSFASIAIFPCFVALAEIFEPKILPRAHAIAITALGLLAIFGTYSRQVWLSLPVGLFLFAVLRLPRKKAIAAIAGGALALFVVFQIPAVRDRAMNGMGIHERLDLWRINFEFFKMRPLTGIGWHHNLPMAGAWYREFHPEIASPFVGHAHSNFFEFLGGLGLFGVAAYFFWTWTTLRQAWRVGGALGAAFFSVWVVFHLNGLTQVNLWESKVLHSMMGSIAMILVALAEKSAKVAPAERSEGGA
ncbi:MAG: O-antigen ligase family protein [Bdellovibrionales bacterium]|nr:O-antigen ligase family protein [Bdellovibrionales bacterium]